MKLQSLVDLDDYKQYVGKEAIDRIRHKASDLQGMHIVHVNSTYYGGGVAELLGSLVVLMINVALKRAGVSFKVHRISSV